MQAATTVWILMPFSVVNAVYALGRTRQYRLFESNIEQDPQTPSARRVKVKSTPVASSPMRLVSSLFARSSADSRAHPDSTRDVWELSVWDPLPASLRLLCLFSPGHVLLYTIFLPLAGLDDRPSVSLAKCLLLQIVMSVQMLIMTSQYTRLQKDTAVIQREVMHEYDTKFVRPHLNPVVRDVGVQANLSTASRTRDIVEVGTPTTLIKRGFTTRPNPNYASHVDPAGSPAPSSRSRAFASNSTVLFGTGSNSPITHIANPATPVYPRSRVSLAAAAAAAAPLSATPLRSRSSGTDFGGTMGVYSHHKSPLKKAHPSIEHEDSVPQSPRNSREMAAMEQQRVRQSSPVKDTRRLTANPFQRGQSQWGERYPSRVG